MPDSDLHDVVKAAFALSPKLSSVALTDGGGSAYYADSAGAFKTISPPPVETLRSPIGAGDCVAAGLACALSRGEERSEDRAKGEATKLRAWAKLKHATLLLADSTLFLTPRASPLSRILVAASRRHLFTDWQSEQPAASRSHPPALTLLTSPN